MSNLDPVRNVLDRLAGVKRTGDGRYMARCPAHDDAHASLCIGCGDDGRALLDCKAGCLTADVVRALGLTMADLFPPKTAATRPRAMPRNPKLPKPPPEKPSTIYATPEHAFTAIARRVKGHFAEAWLYPGDTFRVARFDLAATGPETGKPDKTFRPIHRVANGWSEGDPPGLLPLYRGDELPAEDPIILCEGEGCADAARKNGLPAVTSAHGAKAPHTTDWRALAGRGIIILADNDVAGQQYAAEVAAILTALEPPAVVRVVNLPGLPPKGDICDWVSPDGVMGCKSADEIRAAIVGLAEAAPVWTPAAMDKPQTTTNKADAEKPAQAEAIVRLALARYRLGQTDAGEPFAVERMGANLARVFRGGREAFRAALARDYRRAYGRTANASALADALTTLEGEGLDAVPEAVGLRVADYNGGIVLDLGDSQGRAVIVRPGGWEIVSPSPILFRRTALTSALPAPERGGHLDDLRGLLNVSNDTWPLVRGWLVAALLPSIPHPILLLGGEQGTGKSTAARMLVNLIDPSPAPLRSEPRDPEAWALAAAGSWAVAVDNVSRIPGWWSDALCRAVSGDGWVRRRLYTDGDLSVVAFRRVVILTSIDAGAMRGDLGDRLLLADLSRISEADRRTEVELDKVNAGLRPRALGGLLDTLGDVLARLPNIKVPGLPRMADFGRVLAALDLADGADGCALCLYLAQAGRIAGEVLEADAVAVAVLSLLDRTAGQWEGTTGELLQAIRPADRLPHGWPETARALAGRLKRLTPALRAAGVEVERDRTGHDRARRLTLRRVTEKIVRTVRNDAEGRNPGLLCGQPADDADDCGRSARSDRPPETPETTALASDADDADGSNSPSSGRST
jgi:hypothetical protein